MENVSPILTAKNLNLWYGDFKALKDISLDMGEREITALIGPSGCGKSTFLKTLNRMNDLVPGIRIEGDVRLKGQDIFAREMQPTELRRRVGMVFQKANPFPMSIYDNITYGPRLHGVHNKAELDELEERSLQSAALWNEENERQKTNKKGLCLFHCRYYRILCVCKTYFFSCGFCMEINDNYRRNLFKACNFTFNQSERGGD